MVRFSTSYMIVEWPGGNYCFKIPIESYRCARFTLCWSDRQSVPCTCMATSNVANYIMLLGWLACKSPIKAFCRAFGNAIFSSIHTHPDRTRRFSQYMWMYRLISFILSLFSLRIQSHSFFRTAFLFVGSYWAIRELLKIFPMMWSNVGIWGLAVRGILMLEDAAGEVGGMGVVAGSAVQEELLKLTLVMRSFDGILILFIELFSGVKFWWQTKFDFELIKRLILTGSWVPRK